MFCLPDVYHMDKKNYVYYSTNFDKIKKYLNFLRATKNYKQKS